MAAMVAETGTGDRTATRTAPADSAVAAADVAAAAEEDTADPGRETPADLSAAVCPVTSAARWVTSPANAPSKEKPATPADGRVTYRASAMRGSKMQTTVETDAEDDNLEKKKKAARLHATTPFFPFSLTDNFIFSPPFLAPVEVPEELQCIENKEYFVKDFIVREKTTTARVRRATQRRLWKRGLTCPVVCRR